MELIALDRAARFVSTKPFLDEQDDEGPYPPCYSILISMIVLMITSAIGILAFPYVNKWFFLFGVSTLCTALATLFYLSGYLTYDKLGPKAVGSPLTDFFRVFVAATLKIFRLLPKDDETLQLHVTDGEEFNELSSSHILGFLHKAAIVVGDDKSGEGRVVKKGSWKVCSVSKVESAKLIIRLISVRLYQRRLAVFPVRLLGKSRCISGIRPLHMFQRARLLNRLRGIGIVWAGSDWVGIHMQCALGLCGRKNYYRFKKREEADRDDAQENEEEAGLAMNCTKKSRAR
ncbi:hypothetical protein C2S53_013413 [Perilla frutescens var. hirtella]|uniref:Uncharacterized protein n=1 Tax=Perilla frutescens var. hirtella TaxID=608512 RepID=A0AAD4J677_PERFH|nr:hypothetical protein C2S53_013413 [Perilla frutescens var. hirtella]